MRSKEIEVGGVYTAKVSGKVARVRVLRKGERFDGRHMRDYWDCRNLETNRLIRVRSPLRFRQRLEVVAEE